MIDSALIQLKDVTAGYEGRAVVRNVSLDVMPDSFMALIGPNGGGKTTILRVLLGQIEPMSGTVERADGLRIGYMPQVNDIDLRYPISVADVVLSGQTTGRRLFPSKEVRHRASELLDFASLSGLEKRAIGELSGGQRQRVFLCRALMTEPTLLVLDEPVTYMDRQSETNLYKLLPDLAQRMAIVLVSHDVGTISSVVRTIACVNGTLHYHNSNRITNEMLSIYECPIELISHGTVPHRVLRRHDF